MTAPVSWENRGGVALITIDSPPVNALGQPVREALLAAVEAAEASPAVRALVIAAVGRSFPAGADIREFDRPAAPPHLAELCDRIEACRKPVVAALYGTVLGGGLELALAAHVRIALASTVLGFPEVALGILPGAGGTQRAPRLIGARAALQLMQSGRPIRAAEAQAIGLIDGVVDDGLLEDATALAADLAADLAAEHKLPVPTRDRSEGFRDPLGYEAAVAAARRVAQNPALPAADRIADCVEAALLLPFDAGLAFERAAFDDLVTSPAARGLRHAFLAERRAAKIPEAAAQPRPVDLVGVVGAGRMGAGIVAALLAADLRVTLVERDHDALVDGLERIADLHEAAIARGQMTPDRRDAEWARLAGTTDLSLLAAADLTIEAVPEDAAGKSELFSRLRGVLKPGALLASASATLDLAELAPVAGRPADTLALRFLLPADTCRLVEIGVLPSTSSEAVATAFALVRRLGKVAVRARATPGLIAGRLLAAWHTAADLTIAAGASPYEVDAAMRAWGFAQGPCEAEDALGLDTTIPLRLLLARHGGADGLSTLPQRLAEAGRLGAAAGAGWYLHPPGGSRPQQDPEVLALVARERTRLGHAPQPIPPAEIARRLLLALAAEGTRLVAEGAALRPSDVDTVMVAGLGFPRWRGGPMLTADLTGLLETKTALAALAAEAPALWTPPLTLTELIKYGRRFADLNGA